MQMKMKKKQKKQEELLDNINVLYVALTRASEKLYIITKKKLLRSGLEDFNYYSGIFISFLKDNNLWDENETEYVFGDTTKKVTQQPVPH